MALSKDKLRALALPGVKLRINSLRAEISDLLEEFPELQTAPLATNTNGELPVRPRIDDQVLQVLSDASEPMKAGAVFKAMQALPVPATSNDTSVYASMAALTTKRGLLKRTDEGYVINPKGRKYLQEQQEQRSRETTGGIA